MSNPLLDAALGYAARGWRIFPCRRGQKAPATKNGLHDATDDEATLRRWWSKWPDANVAVATGAGSGVVVADLDVKNGANGFDSYAELEPNPPPTLQQRTPSGGLHRFFKAPDSERVGNRTGVVPGVDVRGDGGYAVVAPSVVDGGQYEWLGDPDDAPLAPCPAWMLRAPSTVSSTGERRATGATTSYGAKALADELARVQAATEGTRNHIFNCAAFNVWQLVHGGEIAEADADELRHAAEGTGLEPDEVARTWASARDSAQPRNAPERPTTTASHAGAAFTTTSTDSAPVQLRYFNDSGIPAPTRWLIDGLIPEESCVVCGSEMKAGKTWLLLKVALALAAKGEVLPGFNASRRGKTLIVSPEGSRSGLQRRLYGMCWGEGIDPDDVAELLPIWPGRVNLGDEGDVAELRRVVAADQPDLLVVDPLVCMTDGSDENSSADMQRLLNALRGLLEVQPQMSILVAHHVAKNIEGRSSWHQLRGSSALGAWADGLISVRRETDDPLAARRLDVWHRDDPSPEPCGFLLSFEQSDHEGIPVVRLTPTVEVPKVNGRASKATDRRTDRLNDIVAVVVAEPGHYTASELARAKPWGVEPRTIERDVASLVSGGRLSREAPTGKLYPVAQVPGVTATTTTAAQRAVVVGRSRVSPEGANGEGVA